LEEFDVKIGYVRVSSLDQNEERQVRALEGLGVEKFYIEKISGKDRNRPQLNEMLNFIREGDRIFIESISRLARNVLDFLNIVNELKEKKVEIVSLKESIDTSTPTGQFMLTVFGAMYQLERENIKERQKEGILIAKEKGIMGRPIIQIDEVFENVYKRWRSGEITATKAIELANMSRTTFYRRVKDFENRQFIR